MRCTRHRQLTFGLVLLVAACAVQARTAADFVGSLTWSVDDPQFGGFSMLEVTDGGTRFTAVTDSAWITGGRLLRGPKGAIAGIDFAPLAPLKGPNGKPLRHYSADAESMARMPDGSLLVSFEGDVRIARYADPRGTPRTLPTPDAFKALPPNKSLEAMATGRDGTIWIVPEYDGGGDSYPVWRYAGGRWDIACRIPEAAAFHPSAADIGPDGRFYLLERRFLGPLGFQSRLRRFDVSDGCLANEALLLQSNVGQFDNLEGLSVWQDARGDIRLTMISDDNFFPLQKTEFVEYRVPKSLDAGVPIR